MAFRSRLSRHNVKQNRRQTVMYLFLSGAVIFFVAKWGLPWMLGVAAKGGSSSKQEEKSNLPVQPPVLADLPEATSSGALEISGIAFPDQKIRLYLDTLVVKETGTDAGGNFNFGLVEFKQGENLIGVQAVAADGGESVIKEAKLVVDTTKPEISIESPANEASFFGSDQQTVEIKGKVDDGEVSVTVNDNFVRVSDNGDFSYKTKLSAGVNELVIAAVDQAGNRTEKLLRLNFSE